MEFVRTPKGQAATHLFIRLPLVWVEGPSDIPFYEGILKGVCRLESAGGRTTARFSRAMYWKTTPLTSSTGEDLKLTLRSACK